MPLTSSYPGSMGAAPMASAYQLTSGGPIMSALPPLNAMPSFVPTVQSQMAMPMPIVEEAPTVVADSIDVRVQPSRAVDLAASSTESGLEALPPPAEQTMEMEAPPQSIVMRNPSVSLGSLGSNVPIMEPPPLPQQPFQNAGGAPAPIPYRSAPISHSLPAPIRTSPPIGSTVHALGQSAPVYTFSGLVP